jgi:hypothetical protein
MLCFTGTAQPPAVLVIEAKLWAEKSETGEDDQLARYLRLLGDLPGLSVKLPEPAFSAVIYLTEREASSEIQDSVRECSEGLMARDRIYGLHWQDIIEAAIEALRSVSNQVSALVLDDVVHFLRVRGLEHFSNFRRVPLPTGGIDGSFYRPVLLKRLPLPAHLVARKGAWVHD